MGRGILLWLLGVPIPVIILLWLFFAAERSRSRREISWHRTKGSALRGAFFAFRLRAD